MGAGLLLRLVVNHTQIHVSQRSCLSPSLRPSHRACLTCLLLRPVFCYAMFDRHGGTDAEMVADKGAKVNLGVVYLQGLQVIS